MLSGVHQYYWSLNPNLQDAELNQAEEASSSHPVALEKPSSTPSSSSVEAADVPPAAEEQTSDQPTETQTEAQSISSPIDLSTKKTPEPDSTTWTAAVAPTATTTGQGIQHSLFVATVVWVSSEMLHLRKKPLFNCSCQLYKQFSTTFRGPKLSNPNNKSIKWSECFFLLPQMNLYSVHVVCCSPAYRNERNKKPYIYK